MAKPPRRPPTFEQMVSTTEPGLGARLGRDWRTLKVMGMMLRFWLVKGRRIRRAWNAAKAAGRPLKLDDDFRKML
jgi:hypothetical protein